MNWSDPNFVSLFAAWGQWAAAFGSFAAVVVAIWIALRSSKVWQKQYLQASYDAARPALVISGDNPIYTRGDRNADDSAYISRDDRGINRFQTINTQLGKHGWIDWNASEHLITLQNVGIGVAFNVMSVIFGPESVEDNGKNLDASKNDYWHCKINILNIGENKACKYSKPLQNLLKGNVDGYSFLAPPQPLIDPSDKKRMLYEDWFVCRVTTTYRDIFKRKHASIFDLDIRGYWIMRAFLEDIPKDLFDLQRDDQPFRVQPLARYLDRFSKKKQ